MPVALYTNPVWGKDFPDPFILPWRGRFYAYATETPPYRFQVMESSDLVNWTHRGTAFVPPWSGEHFWAPEVHPSKGQLHFLYSARNPQTGKHDIGIAVSRNPLGPYTKTGQILTGDGKNVYGPGHQAYLKLHSGEEWLFYHAWDDQNEPRYGSNPLGRTLRLDKLVWEKDRPRILGPTVTPQPAPHL
jgi:beta-xylosidase